MISELIAFHDPRTNRPVRQLTNYKGHSHHLYFTNPGWFDGGRRLLFGSDRGNRTNLFSVERATGEITQHTDADQPNPAVSFLFASLNPRRPEAYFWRGRELRAVDLTANRERLLFTAPDRFSVNMTNVTADGRHLCTALYEDLAKRFRVDLLHGYVGFAEYHDAHPESRILKIDIDTGHADTVFTEHYWIGHVNTSPTQPHLLSYCHEGPWEKVDNRIWGCDLATGKVWPIRQATAPGEVIGHEYWHADGIHLGFHGYRSEYRQFFGRVRYDDTEAEDLNFPYHPMHVFSDDYDLIVGDNFGPEGKVILLWRRTADGFATPRILCEHRSSAHVQQVHVHPRFSPDRSRVLFTSDRTGYGQVYEVEIGDIDALPEATVPSPS